MRRSVRFAGAAAAAAAPLVAAATAIAHDEFVVVGAGTSASAGRVITFPYFAFQVVDKTARTGRA